MQVDTGIMAGAMVVQAVALIVLVGVTIRYARSANAMVQEARDARLYEVLPLVIPTGTIRGDFREIQLDVNNYGRGPAINVILTAEHPSVSYTQAEYVAMRPGDAQTPSPLERLASGLSKPQTAVTLIAKYQDVYTRGWTTRILVRLENGELVCDSVNVEGPTQRATPTV